MRVFPITPKRYANYFKWRVRCINPVVTDWHLQFTPFSAVRTSADTCVIGNGIPKCGTYLINSILRYLGKWQNIGVFMHAQSYEITAQTGDSQMCLRRFAVKKLRDGQLASGHLAWEQGLAKSLRQMSPDRHLKHVLIYRDPRDAYISGMNYATYVGNYSEEFNVNQRARAKFMLNEFPGDDERLTYIMGLPGVNTHMDYEPWLRDPNCFAVKFEDLYPAILDLQNGEVAGVLGRLLDYLGTEEDIDPLDFYHAVRGNSITASPLLEKIGQYKKLFKDQHYALIDNPEFRRMLSAFGYEW